MLVGRVLDWDIGGVEKCQGSKSGTVATEVRHGLTTWGRDLGAIKSVDRLFYLCTDNMVKCSECVV